MKLKQRLSGAVLRLLGWRVLYEGMPRPKGVIVIYPHTSNWDFVIGMLAKWSIDLDVRWIGKDSLFNGRLAWMWNWLLRAWGGSPVRRDSSNAVVSQVCETIHESASFWFGLSPEGTRKYQPYWRSGFYHIAREAKVPVCLAYLDYPNKEVGAREFMLVTGDEERDLSHIRQYYKGRHGVHSQNESPIVFRHDA